MRERNEVHVDSQEHELDGHQQHDEVLTVHEDANHAQGKERGTHNQEMRERH
jgi:hypothetical protein